MSIKRVLVVIALATSVLLGGGVVTATNAFADPQVIRCVMYPPDYMVFNYPGVYTMMIFNAHLVQTDYNSDNVPINCLYKGDVYSRTGFAGPWTYQFPYSYNRPLFELI
jgi:hypothetical protein